jgi:hypothetical protein
VSVRGVAASIAPATMAAEVGKLFPPAVSPAFWGVCSDGHVRLALPPQPVLNLPTVLR